MRCPASVKYDNAVCHRECQYTANPYELNCSELHLCLSHQFSDRHNICSRLLSNIQTLVDCASAPVEVKPEFANRNRDGPSAVSPRWQATSRDRSHMPEGPGRTFRSVLWRDRIGDSCRLHANPAVSCKIKRYKEPSRLGVRVGAAFGPVPARRLNPVLKETERKGLDMRTGVIGLGDMGSGLAKNLIKNGFEVSGFDLGEERMAAFEEMGGLCASSVADVGMNAEAVFVMVMNGDQARSVILDDDGLAAQMAQGGAIILTATIKPREAREIGAALDGSGIHLIDSPVSGGYPGAQSGALTMMASAPDAVLDRFAPVMEAVSGTIHRIGDAPGMGQTVKACLQTLIGSIFSATFEASVLAAKAGVKGEHLFNVFSTSSAGCGCVNTALENIIDRKFENTGSGIGTMHKDLTISLDLAEELEVPLQMASAAMQIFHAGKSRFPRGDNWACTRVIEDIVGAGLRR